MWVNGVIKINNNAAAWVWTDNFNIAFVAGNLYQIIVKYVEFGGGAAIELKWSSPSISKQVIPSSYFVNPNDLSPQFVGSYPYQVTTVCPIGYTGNDPSSPTQCKEIWGDAKRIGTEKWDDGNTNNGDGWNSACTSVEASWVWSGGSSTSKDTCTFWSSGYYQNNAVTPTTWITHWGDGLRAGTEKCDDGNTANSDGCKSDWSSVEASWVWDGGTTTTKDTWIFWTSGYYQNSVSNPTTCVSHWGDGKDVGTEKCDDGNTANGDGCKSDWSGVEASWVCTGGSATTKDTCTFWSSGFYQNDSLNPTAWVTQCGDGLEAGTEKCDDGNTVNGDGCKSDWSSVESSWVWSGGSTTSKDTWTFCTSGLYQNNPLNPTVCVPHCGDSLRAGTEKCDDGNTVNSDGCKSDWSSVEASWVWEGGTTTTKDVCTFWTSGFYQNDPINPTLWVSHWGDGLEVGTEKWDDGNTASGDGWKSDWSGVETSWVWDGGSSTTKDTCTFWSSGFYQNDPINPTIWVTHWGDGLRAGTEKWDDGNTSGGDGCKLDWSSVEASWVWDGGTPTTIDKWSFCSSGFYQNNPLNPTVWVTHCGDGLRAGSEKWDDGNTINKDGWSSTCSSIESGWVWRGGTPISQDFWEKWSLGFVPNNTTNPEYCVEVWGDSRRVGKEKWDDGNLLSGDGWSITWTIETGWRCSGGNVTNHDSWAKWPAGYSSSSDGYSWVVAAIPDSIKSAQTAVTSVSGVGMGLNMASSAINNSSPQGSLSMINAVQLLLLLPLIGTYLPQSILDFIRGLNFNMLNFDFLTSKFQNDENGASSFVDFDQANDYLNLIGLQSGSTAINLLTTALIFLMLPIIHILVGLYYLYIKKNSNHRNWWLILFKKLFDSLTFGVYIRTLFEAYVSWCYQSLQKSLTIRKTTYKWEGQ